ncbi:MAG: hypothetical protein H6643_16930 [Caldilineaceae bacterium]|nr:hypothetical protein [Caldilineaceae bacterium]
MGIRFVTARSTSGAMEQLQQQRRRDHFGHGTDRDQFAGYTLLDRKRGEGIHRSFIIYSSSNKGDPYGTRPNNGAFGATNDQASCSEL